jgi:hypothetical protein
MTALQALAMLNNSSSCGRANTSPRASRRRATCEAKVAAYSSSSDARPTAESRKS